MVKEEDKGQLQLDRLQLEAQLLFFLIICLTKIEKTVCNDILRLNF